MQKCDLCFKEFANASTPGYDQVKHFENTLVTLCGNCAQTTSEKGAALVKKFADNKAQAEVMISQYRDKYDIREPFTVAQTPAPVAPTHPRVRSLRDSVKQVYGAGSKKK